MLHQQLPIRFVSVSFIMLVIALCAASQGPMPLLAGQLFAPKAQVTFDCTAVVSIPRTECEALVVLYNSTDGPNWRKQDNWFVTNDPCNWHGVLLCANGRIVRLGFFDNKLTGEIPDAIGAFTQLTILNLHLNRLRGTIPTVLSTLTLLTQLRLDQNSLLGSIPPELANLRQLELLNLGFNDLTGSIPPELGSITSLQRLILQDNALVGPLPATLTNLTGLVRLYVGNNRLEGPLPADLDKISNLEDFQVHNNQFSGELPAALVALQDSLDPTETFFAYNRFTSTNSAVRTAMQSIDVDWESTQTVPPTNLQGSPISATSIQLTWQKILYVDETHGGHYEVSYAPAGGNYTIVSNNPSKIAESYLLTGLQPSTTYRIRLRTFSPAHDFQQNDLYSDYTPELSVTTPALSTNTLTPTATPFPTDTATATATSTATPTLTPTSISSNPTETATPSPTLTLTPTPEVTGVGGPDGCTVVDRNSGALVCQSYLPIVALPPTPTATPTLLPIATVIPVWQQLAGNGLNVVTLAVQGDTLFVGTSGSSGANRGLYRGNLATCRTGVTLAPVADVNGAGPHSIQDLVFAGTHGVVASHDRGLYFTNDGGNNWQTANPALPNPSTVAYVNGIFYAGTALEGIYQSLDQGANWTLLSRAPSKINVIRLDEAVPDVLWIGTEDDGVYSLRRSTLTQNKSGLDAAGQIVWDFAFDLATVYVATDGGIFAGNGSAAWTPYGPSPSGVQFRSLVLINDTLYAGASGNGVWRRSLVGGDWERVTSPGWNDSSTVRDLLYDPTHCGGLLAATNDGVWLYPLRR